MNRLKRWEWMLPFLLGLPLTTPLWRWTAVPCTHDGHLYYHLVAALKHLWMQGVFFSRWMPDLAFGYGYPYFIYREPIPLYAVLVPHRLGLPLPAAANLFYVLCILMAGVGMFLWARDLFGRRSGLVSGMAYMAAPYMLIDSLVRGNAPEMIGLAVAPFLLWSGRRWMRSGGRWPFLHTMIGMVVLGLSHNISTLLFVPTLFVYLIIVGMVNRRGGEIARVCLIVGLGVGLTVWYTGTAVLELDRVTIAQATTTRNNDFHFNYGTLGEIFSSVAPENKLELNRPLPIRLGWVPVGLAVVGMMMGMVRGSREQKWHVGMMGIGAVIFIFLTLRVSEPVWEHVPLLEFVQFPWRLVGRAALPVALLAGVGFGEFYRREVGETHELHLPIWTYAAVGVVIVGLFVEVVPYLYPSICPQEGFPTIGAVHAYERSSGFIGIDPEGSYFPKTVESRPDGSSLEADYEAGYVPERFVGDGVVSAEYGVNKARIQVEASDAYTATYQTFAFAGWGVDIDGEAVEIGATVPDGLMMFEVPAGEHVIDVFWRGTLGRKLLIGVSVVAGMLCMWVFFNVERSGRRTKAQRHKGFFEERINGFLVVLGCVVVMFVVKGVVDRVDTAVRFEGIPDMDMSGMGLQARELELIGHNVSRPVVPSGETFDMDLMWLVHGVPGGRYQSTVWLADEQGVRWSEKGIERPRIYEDGGRTDFWLPGHWAWDSWEVDLLDGTPASEYDLMLNLFDLETLRPFVFNNGSVDVVIGTVEVGVSDHFDENFYHRERGEVLGFWVDREDARPGDAMLVTIVWARGDDEVRSLVLVDEMGETVQTWEVGWVRSREMVVREQLLGRLAAGLEGGTYYFELDGVRLGDIEVSGIERVFVLDDDVESVNARFEGGIQLMGIKRDGSQWVIFWKSENEIKATYRVFVHLVDGNGAIVNQSDGEPGLWARPTTSWIANEIVADPHVVAGDGVALRIGLYDARDGARLLLNEGGDMVVVPILNRDEAESGKDTE